MKGFGQWRETTQAPYLPGWLSIGFKMPKWEMLAESSKSFFFFEWIAQSKVCLSVEIFRRTSYHFDLPAPGTLWMLLLRVLSLFVVLIFNGLLHVSKGEFGDRDRDRETREGKRAEGGREKEPRTFCFN